MNDSKVRPVDPAKCDHLKSYFIQNGMAGARPYAVHLCPQCGRLNVLLHNSQIDIYLPALAHVQAIMQHYRWLDGVGRDERT